MCHSYFVTDGGPNDDPAEISKACYAFEQFLQDHGFDRAVVNCGFEDGEFVNAEDAVDLVYEFLEKHPEFQPDAEEIRKHAFEIGQVGV